MAATEVCAEMTSLQEEIFKCVQSGDLERIKELLESEAFTEEDDVCGMMKDEVGRNALLLASVLGRSSIARELITHGAQVNEHTDRGYSSLHLAACWGHLETVRTLVDLEADTQAKTFKGDRPVDLARTYSKTDCVDCLILAEARQELKSYIAFVKESITDPQKSLTREEKNVCMRRCSAKSDWIHTVSNSTVSDFIAQRKDIEDTLQPILRKLSTR